MDFVKLLGLVEDVKVEAAALEAALPAELKAARDAGFAEGVAQTGVDKIYNQAELDAKIEEATAALKLQLDESALKISELEAKVGEIDAKVAEAVAAMKADLLAQYEAQQVAESSSETGFAALLK